MITPNVRARTSQRTQPAKSCCHGSYSLAPRVVDKLYFRFCLYLQQKLVVLKGLNATATSYCYHLTMMGRDSSVDTATRYILDGPEIESRWSARFSAPVQTGRGAHPASCTMGTGSFPGVKWPGRGVDHPPSSIAEVEERVELYVYSPYGFSWPVVGLTTATRWQ